MQSIDFYKWIKKAIAITIVGLSIHAHADQSHDDMGVIQQAMFELHSGTEQGAEKAYTLVNNAYKESNSVIAAKFLAELYYSGVGVGQDKQAALEYFLIAGQEDPEANYKAGTMMIYGDDVDTDVEYGSELIRESAESGYAVAQANLAESSLKQLKLEKNPVIKEALRKNAFHYSQMCSNSHDVCKSVLEDLMINKIS